jgi:hypothetical protein
MHNQNDKLVAECRYPVFMAKRRSDRACEVSGSVIAKLFDSCSTGSHDG